MPNQSILNRALKAQQYLEDNPEKKEIKDRFLELYSMCEMVCKDALFDVRMDAFRLGSSKKEPKLENIQMKHSEIFKAFEDDFSEDFIWKMFGDRKNKLNPYKVRMNKSAKMLREEISHALSIEAIEEVYSRRDELFQMLESFITTLNKDVEL